MSLRTQRTVGWQRELLTARVRLTGLSVLASVRHPFKPQGFQAKLSLLPGSPPCQHQILLDPGTLHFATSFIPEPCILQCLTADWLSC